MRIGVISDTHGFFHPALPTYFSGLDLILHAGDVGTLDVLEQLEALAPTRAVWGNVDGQDIRVRTSENLRLDAQGVDILMTHIAGRPGRWNRRIATELRSDPPDVLICGHSHILRVERVDSPPKMLFINPGAAGRQGFHQVKTCLRLEVFDDRVQQAEVIHLDEP